MRKVVVLLLICCFLVQDSVFAFSLFGKHKKDTQLELEMEGKGYAGTLPDLEKDIKEQKQVEKVTPIFESQSDFNDPGDLKPVPTDNPSFLNIIQKKDKTSEYVLDTKNIIDILEKIVDCIEDEGNVQLFNTRANVLVMNLDALQKKYNGQPESYYESFIKLMEINRHAKTLMQLRYEATRYQKYLAYQSTGSMYNPENINQQLEYFKEEINSTIIMLKKDDQ